MLPLINLLHYSFIFYTHKTPLCIILCFTLLCIELNKLCKLYFTLLYTCCTLLFIYFTFSLLYIFFTLLLLYFTNIGLVFRIPDSGRSLWSFCVQCIWGTTVLCSFMALLTLHSPFSPQSPPILKMFVMVLV